MVKIINILFIWILFPANIRTRINTIIPKYPTFTNKEMIVWIKWEETASTFPLDLFNAYCPKNDTRIFGAMQNMRVRIGSSPIKIVFEKTPMWSNIASAESVKKTSEISVILPNQNFWKSSGIADWR